MNPFKLSFFLLGLGSASAQFYSPESRDVYAPVRPRLQRPSFWTELEEEEEVDPRVQLRQFQQRRRLKLARGGRQAPSSGGFRDRFDTFPTWGESDGATYDENNKRNNRYNENAPFDQLRAQQEEKRQNSYEYERRQSVAPPAQRRRDPVQNWNKPDPVFRRYQEEVEEEPEVRREVKVVEEERPRRPVYKRPAPERRPAPRVDNDLLAVIDDVEADQETVPAQVKEYKPASGPAYAQATNMEQYEAMKAQARLDFGALDYSKHGGGADSPPEQRGIESAVFAGANKHGPDGVFQTENRIDFQINGHKGPHSYRYGYDTGHGYNRQFRYEERDGHGYVKGRYGFFDKYGKLQVVNYSADPHKGFHAEGAHVPHHH